MSDELSIRTATPADLAPLLELGRRTFVDTFAAYNDPDDFAACLNALYTVERFDRDLSDGNTRFFLVEQPQSGLLVAYARLRWGNVPACVPDADAIEIEKFYVDLPHLGRGIGPVLMRHCLAFAREMGRKTIYLSVWEHNTRAVRFYEKWGYRRVGEHIFHVGTDPQIDWWMMRSVD